jgi:hypothetical protein
MFAKKTIQKIAVEPSEPGWHSLYWAAGMGALMAVALLLLDIALSFAGGDAAAGSLSVVEWFALFQNNWFVGLRNLGLFNVINFMLTMPLYLALYQIHRKAAPAFAALAMMLFLFGAATYTANNRALSMLTLSSQYAAAASEAQQDVLVAAGTVLLAQAEDFTPGAFMGFFLSSAASIVMLSVMLASKIFPKWIALVGLTGSVFLLLFTVSVTFAPAVFETAMIFAMLGGLLMMAWNIAVALRMFRLGLGAAKQSAAEVEQGQFEPASIRS